MPLDVDGGLPADAMALVTAFRQEVLQGVLLSWDDLPTWLDAQDALEAAAGLPVRTIHVPLPLDVTIELTPAGVRLTQPWRMDVTQPIIGWSMSLLRYALPGDGWAHCRHIRHGGTLLRLQEVARFCAPSMAIEGPEAGEAAATVYILTGVVIAAEEAAPRAPRPS